MRDTPPFTIRVIVHTEELDALVPAWERLHTDARGTLFQTPFWNLAWWKHYGSPYALCVVTVYSGETLTGVLPMFVEQTSLGPVHLKRLRFLGARYAYGEYLPLVHPHHVQAVCTALAEYCVSEVRSGSVDIIELHRVPDHAPVTDILYQHLSRRGIHARYTHRMIPRAIARLPATWDEHLHSLATSERATLGRRERSLTRKGVSLDVVTTIGSFQDAFADFVCLHGASWHPRGYTGYFESLAGFRDFLEEVTSAAVERREARLYFFRHSGRRFAAVLAFFVNRQCCFYLSGLDRHDPMTRYSPGKVLLARVIRDAIEEEYEVFDFQGGTEDYKYRLGGRKTWFSKISVRRSGISGIPSSLFLVAQLAGNFTINAILEERLRPFIRRLFGRQT